MLLRIFFLCTVLFLKPFQNNGLLSGSSFGSLSDLWTANFTLYMDDFSSITLYLTDYEKNILMVKPDLLKDHQKVLVVMYNKEVQSIYLKSLCGCDPCNKELVNLYLRGTDTTILVQCNNVGYYSLSKVNIVNRYNPAMLPKLAALTPPRNQVRIVVVATTRGCLISFYYNLRPVTFRNDNSNFLRSCPKKCSPSICNGGKCQPMEKYGPLCDCSSTVFNGPRCNNGLKVYKQEVNTSYELVDEYYNVKLKMSWRRFTDKKFCLLQFLHIGNHDTLSIYGSHLIRGSTILADMDGHGINFLTLSMINNRLQMKVNNKVVESRRVLLDNTIINIGFSKNQGECETFEGIYDIDLQGSGIRALKSVTCIDCKSSSSTSMFHWKFILGGVAILLVIGVVVSIVVAIRRCKRRGGSKRNEQNVYEVPLRANKFNHTLNCQDDEYDWVDPDKVYRSQIMSTESELPKLPLRKF